jgi:hypothetical protein
MIFLRTTKLALAATDKSQTPGHSSGLYSLASAGIDYPLIRRGPAVCGALLILF